MNLTISSNLIEQPMVRLRPARSWVSGKSLLLVFFYFLTPAFIAFNAELWSPLTDSFHEGEYLGNLANVHNYLTKQDKFPVFIHGPMDYIPSLAASLIWDSGHIVLWTRFLNVLIGMIAWIAWLDLSRVVLRHHAYRYAWSAIFFLLFLWMALAAEGDPVHKQQAFIGTRDVFLITSIWAAIQAARSKRLKLNNLLFALSGALAAASFYWCYDREVISIFWVIGIVLTFAVIGRTAASIAIVFGYAAALFLISKMHVFGTMAENAHNILYWMQNNRDVWHMSVRLKIDSLPYLLGSFLLAFLVMLHAIRYAFHDLKDDRSPIILSLVAVQLLLLLKLFNLPGFPASYYTIWPSFLILILTPPKLAVLDALTLSIGECRKTLYASWRESAVPQRRAGAAAIAALTLVLLSNAAVSSLIMAKKLLRPPADSTLVNANLYDGDYLASQNAPCVFQWSNEGVFSFLTQRPYCTKYAYAVYISHQEEPSVLRQLQLSPPSLIIYDSPFWSADIFSRSMQQRLPLIDAFIRQTYVFHKSRTGYVFATPKGK